MKIAFFSNYLNHHQLPFCIAMDRLTRGQFVFVATTPTPSVRLEFGYHDMNKQYPFVLTTYDSLENAQLAHHIALESDVVIAGAAPEIYTKMRMKHNKLTFRYSERLYRRGLWRALSPKGLRLMVQNHRAYRNNPLYMLCASAYTALDYSLTGSYLGKTFKWGYFPEVKIQDIDLLFEKKRMNARTSILWVARLISLKHPEIPIQIAERLRKEGYLFDLNFVGNGELEEELKATIRTKGLENCVHLLGAMSPEAVRKHMEGADIFLFTSDFREGWGAVLNESMNSGCAVVASHAIGAVPFLIEDGKNGFIYKNGDVDGLYNRVVKLIEQPELREEMGRAAYQTLADQWNAEVAAERFITLAQALLDGKKADLFKNGPCSRAKILKNWWYKND